MHTINEYIKSVNKTITETNACFVSVNMSHIRIRSRLLLTAKQLHMCLSVICGILHICEQYEIFTSYNSQSAFYVNLYRAVIGPSTTLTGR